MPKSSEDSRDSSKKSAKKKSKSKSCDYAEPEDNYPEVENRQILPSVQAFDSPSANWTTIRPRSQAEFNVFNDNFQVRHFLPTPENMSYDPPLCGIERHFKNLYSSPLGAYNHNSFNATSSGNSSSYWLSHAQSVPSHSRWTTNYASHMMENQQNGCSSQKQYYPHYDFNAASCSYQAQQGQYASKQAEQDYYAKLTAEWSDISDGSDDEQPAPMAVDRRIKVDLLDRNTTVDETIAAIATATGAGTGAVGAAARANAGSAARVMAGCIAIGTPALRARAMYASALAASDLVVAREAADNAAREAAENAARVAAENAARDAADKAAWEAADKAASDTTNKAAREAAHRVARDAADKATRKAASDAADNVGGANGVTFSEADRANCANISFDDISSSVTNEPNFTATASVDTTMIDAGAASAMDDAVAVASARATAASARAAATAMSLVTTARATAACARATTVDMNELPVRDGRNGTKKKLNTATSGPYLDNIGTKNNNLFGETTQLKSQNLFDLFPKASADKFVPVNSSIADIMKANSGKAIVSANETKPIAQLLPTQNLNTTNSVISKSTVYNPLSKEQIDAEMEYNTSKMELLRIRTQNNNKKSILLDLQCEAARQQLELLKFEKDAAEKTLMLREQQLHLLAKRKKMQND